MRSICLLLLLSAAVISADLQSDFNDIIDHLPKERIAQIAQDYAPTDSRFRSGSSFLQGFNLQHFLQTEEVKNIVNYLHAQGFDTQAIIYRFIPQLLGYPSRLDKLRSASNQVKPVSSSKMSTLLQEKIKTSPEFAKFAKAVQDSYFKKLLYQALNSKTSYEDSEHLDLRGFWTRLFKKIIALFEDDDY